MPPNQVLRCELRGNETRAIDLSANPASHFHFLLFSSEEGVKIYQEWNSWGYYARSFVATDSNSNTYQISRRQGEWDKNAPTTHSLHKGDVLVTDICFSEGTWQVSPKLPRGQLLVLNIIGRFQNKTAKDDMNKSIWTGQIESKPVEIILEKECVERLNAER